MHCIALIARYQLYSINSTVFTYVTSSIPPFIPVVVVVEVVVEVEVVVVVVDVVVVVVVVGGHLNSQM